MPAWVDLLSAKQYTHDINANALPIVAGKGGASFSDFGTLAAAVGGAKIIVSVNGYTDTPQSAGAFAKFALTNHIPVAVWELDNEPYTWLNTDAGVPGPFFSDAAHYVTNMKAFRDAIKAADPNAVRMPSQQTFPKLSPYLEAAAEASRDIRDIKTCWNPRIGTRSCRLWLEL